MKAMNNSVNTWLETLMSDLPSFSKRDGMWALFDAVILWALNGLTTFIIRNYPSANPIYWAMGCTVVSFIYLFIVLRIRHQPGFLPTLMMKRPGNLLALAIFSIAVISAILLRLPKSDPVGLIFMDILKGIVIVGVGEEFWFRGYLWPRIAALIPRKIWGLLLSGVMFGMMHFAVDGFKLNALGNNILGYVLGHVFFLLLYVKSKSIWVAAVIHGLPHFF